MNNTLEQVEKALNDYMEEKRGKFPRFYFLSNDELIDILANSNNFGIIQQHLKTLFDNIVKVDFVEDSIEAINSSNLSIGILEIALISCFNRDFNSIQIYIFIQSLQ